MLHNDRVSEIQKFAKNKHFRDGTAYRSLSVESIRSLSKALNVGPKEIEILALEAEIVPERYARNMKTFSPENQATLLRSGVAVVGLGGLGGGVTEILARIGIGTLELIDGDTFEDSNLNRQLLSSQENMGVSKARTAMQRVEKINSSITVNSHAEFIDAQNGPGLLNQAAVVVDCLDSLKTRFVLERLTKKMGIPLVSAAIAGVTGHVTTIFPEDSGLKLIYGEADLAPAKGAEASLGTLPHCVTTVAAIETSEVIKILLGSGNVLRNRLLIIDLQDNTFEVMHLSDAKG